MFSNAQKLHDEASSGNLHFDASGFRRQGSVLNRVGESFMFTNPFPANASEFTLSDTAPPFKYQVQYSGVSNIFNSGRYRYYYTVNNIDSGVYIYPSEPTRPTPPAPPPPGPSPPPSEPPSGPAPGTPQAAGDIIWNSTIVTGNGEQTGTSIT